MPSPRTRGEGARELGRCRENSDRICEQANDFFKRADKNHHRDLYKSGTGLDGDVITLADRIGQRRAKTKMRT
jgi:hypothetical protein